MLVLVLCLSDSRTNRDLKKSISQPQRPSIQPSWKELTKLLKAGKLSFQFRLQERRVGLSDAKLSNVSRPRFES
jgi:hypothetical protein